MTSPNSVPPAIPPVAPSMRPTIGGWKTIVGSILIALAPVGEQYVPGIGEKVFSVIQGLGIILGAVGIRTAISKNGRGV